MAPKEGIREPLGGFLRMPHVGHSRIPQYNAYCTACEEHWVFAVSHSTCEVEQHWVFVVIVRSLVCVVVVLSGVGLCSSIDMIRPGFHSSLIHLVGLWVAIWTACRHFSFFRVTYLNVLNPVFSFIFLA